VIKIETPEASVSGVFNLGAFFPAASPSLRGKNCGTTKFAQELNRLRKKAEFAADQEGTTRRG
jgi:hypothetical protein